MCTSKYHEYACECIWRSAPKVCPPDVDCIERLAPVITRIRCRQQCASCQTEWLEQRVASRENGRELELEGRPTMYVHKTLDELVCQRKNKDRIMDQVKDKDEAMLRMVRRGAGPVEGKDWVRIVKRGLALSDQVSVIDEITVGQPPRRCSYW